MKSIQQSMLEEIYMKAQNIARTRRQSWGEKHDYVITLQQLEDIIKELES
jgi:hypothetical protein